MHTPFVDHLKKLQPRVEIDLFVSVNTVLLKCFRADDRIQNSIMERKSRSLSKNCYLPQIRG